MSVSSLLQSSPEMKGNGSFFFLHITKRMLAPLEMPTLHQSSRSVFRVSGSPYYLDFLCFSSSFWYFMDDRWGLSLHLQIANKEERVYLSISLFMYISTSISEGFLRIASRRPCLYLLRLKNYGADDLFSVFIEFCCSLNVFRCQGLLGQPLKMWNSTRSKYWSGTLAIYSP